MGVDVHFGFRCRIESNRIELNRIEKKKKMEDDSYERLIHLKEIYMKKKKELDDVDLKTQMPCGRKGARVSMLATRDSDSQNSNSPSVSSSKRRSDLIEPVMLYAVVKKMLQKCGGSAHVDTLVKAVQLKWPALRQRRSGKICTTADYKKQVVDVLGVEKRTREAGIELSGAREHCYSLRGNHVVRFVHPPPSSVTSESSESANVSDAAEEKEKQVGQENQKVDADDEKDDNDVDGEKIDEETMVDAEDEAAMKASNEAALVRLDGEPEPAADGTYERSEAPLYTLLCSALTLAVPTQQRIYREHEKRQEDARNTQLEHFGIPEEFVALPPLPNDAADMAAPLVMIERYVARHWARPHLGGEVMSDADVKEAIRLVLNTDVLFQCTSEYPVMFRMRPQRKRAASLRGGDDESGSSSPSSSSSSSSSSASSAPKSRSRTSSSASSRRGKRRRDEIDDDDDNDDDNDDLDDIDDDSDDDSGDNEEVEDDGKGTWICCDNCGKWLKAEDDGITDISIYDDKNPNHLDYFCPKCRRNRDKRSGGGNASSRSRGGNAKAQGGRRRAGSSAPSAKRQRSGSERSRRRSTASSGGNGAGSSPPSSPSSSSLASTSSSSSLQSASSPAHSSATSPSAAAAAAAAATANAGEDRLQQLFDELIGEHKPDAELLGELGKYKDKLVDIRTKLWRRNAADFENNVARLQEQFHRLNQRAEHDLLEKLRSYVVRSLQ
jgi:hypothetical protein